MKYPDIDAALEDAHERIEQIEKVLSEDGVTADGFDKRIEALERLTQHTCEALGRDGVAGRLEALENADCKLAPHEAEYLRQDRWHATRDAALPGYISSSRFIGEDWLALAANLADCAHGPLEGTQEPFSEMDLAAHLRHVEALVKAARGMVAGLAPDEDGLSAQERKLIAALQPFETERGE